jgi:hypothetical protein
MIQKIFLFTIIAIIAFSVPLQAQVKSADNSVPDSSIIYVNGDGTYFNFGTKDKFQVNLNGILSPGFQFRSYNVNGEVTKENQMSINLARLSLNFSAFNGLMTAAVKADFTGTSPLLEAWVAYNSANQHHSFIFGERQSISNNRLALEDEKYASTLGPTINGLSNDGSIYGGLMQNFVVTTREGGLFYKTNFTIGRSRLYGAASITSGQGQSINSTQTNLGLKYGGRIDFMPMGDFIKNNAFISQDIYFEQNPKLGIGIAGSYAVKATTPVAGSSDNAAGIYDQDGEPTNANYRKLVADLIFKYQGFAFVAEYTDATVYGKNLYSDAASTKELTPEAASAKYNIGDAFNFQASYVWKNGWALEGRYSIVTPEFNVENSIVQKQNWYTGSFNKYLKNYAIKIGINATYIDESAVTGSEYTWISNLAIQLSF